MNMMLRNGLRLFALGFVCAMVAGFFHPAPGWLLDISNVLGAAAVMNLLVGFDMYLVTRREERSELLARRLRYVAAIEEQNRPLQLMLLQLPVDPSSVYIRCEVHGIRPGIHYHQPPPRITNGVVLHSPHIRAYYDGECPECDSSPLPWCQVCGERHRTETGL